MTGSRQSWQYSLIAARTLWDDVGNDTLFGDGSDEAEVKHRLD